MHLSRRFVKNEVLYASRTNSAFAKQEQNGRANVWTASLSWNTSGMLTRLISKLVVRAQVEEDVRISPHWCCMLCTPHYCYHRYRL
mmetsp:Transcript_19702/g.53086  ORF Transcript_19702/g.53086 Transcript_19702/m.53086 type:complete len:86 (-) Transcript_19702:8-265(-)